MTQIFSPFESHIVFPIFSIYLTNNLGLIITNQTVILALVFVLIFFYLYSLLSKDNTFLAIPTRAQAALEILILFVLSVTQESIHNKKGEKHFPIIFSLFIFIFSLNLIGLIPYSFALTGQFVITLTLSLVLFIGINIFGIMIHGLKMLNMFLPSNVSLNLVFLVSPFEFILYIFRPFSLATRLFCNIVASHLLLVVIFGFIYKIAAFGGLISLINVFPILILIALFFLELVLAFVQTFIFCLLVSNYLSDVLDADKH
jgi:F-type H+-transporting ATPase subunit a